MKTEKIRKHIITLLWRIESPDRLRKLYNITVGLWGEERRETGEAHE